MSEAGDRVAIEHLVRADAATSHGTRPYAEALVNAAEKAGAVDAVFEDLEEIQARVLLAFPRFHAILKSPTVSVADKARILNETFGDRVHPIVSRFLGVLNTHGRLDLLDRAIDEARALLERRRNRRLAVVHSAVELNDSTKQLLEKRVATMTGSTPLVHYVVDPSLIGGFSVRVGDRVYDLSLKSRLRQMRERLMKAKSREIRDRASALAVN
jgi:F-type H+-transporting ATPase subunit delta